MNRTINSRGAWVAVLAAVLIFVTSGIAFVDCPFLMQNASADGSCCPRPQEPTEPPHCPFAPSLQTCPYLVDDDELIVAEARYDATLDRSTAVGHLWEAPAPDFRPVLLQRDLDGRDLHIRLRVFLN